MYNDYSGPSLHCLRLHSLLIGPAPSSTPDVLCPSSPTVFFHLSPPLPPQDYMPTWAYPVSVPAHRKPVSLPSLTHHYPIPTPHPLPSPCHAYRIPIAASPPLLPKYFSTWPPVVVSSASCRHYGSRNFPPTSYPIYFEQTSNIGRRSTQSATIACLLLIYSRSDLVPAT